MQVVQAAVETGAVNVALAGAVIAQFADPVIDVLVVGPDRAAVAEGAQILLDDEADADRIREFADLEIGRRASRIACALSSTTSRPYSSAILWISRIGAHWP